MKELIRITTSLTLSCLIAGVVMGSVFMLTDKAKRHNEQINISQTMLGLLGYDKDNPSPADLELYTIYRYIIEDGAVKTLGYMIPVETWAKGGFELVIIDLAGQFVNRFNLNITPENAAEPPERKAALNAVNVLKTAQQTISGLMKRNTSSIKPSVVDVPTVHMSALRSVSHPSSNTSMNFLSKQQQLQ